MLHLKDANLDQQGERLRAPGEVASFLLENPQLSEKLNILHYQLLPTDRDFRRKLLTSNYNHQRY